MDVNGHFLSLNETNNKYNLQCSFLDHMRIRQSIPGKWRHILTQNNTTTAINLNHQPLNIIINRLFRNVTHLKSNSIYLEYIDKLVHTKSPTCINRWGDQYQIDPNIYGRKYSKHPLILAEKLYYKLFNIASFTAYYHATNGCISERLYI